MITRRLTACAGLFLITLGTQIAGQGAGSVLEQGKGDSDDVATLRAIGAGASALSVPDQLALLKRGIADTNSDVQVAALNAVLGRAAAGRFASTNRGVQANPSIGKSELSELRPSVEAALTDRSAKVRLAALMAFGNIELSGSVSPGTRQRLNAETSKLLYGVFNAETDRAIRFEIVKGFALAGQSSSETKEVIRRTLNESDDGILQYAIMGVRTLDAPELLPRVIPHLTHSNAAIRLAAATTVGRFPSEASVFRKQLEEALARETRAEIQQILRNALKGA